MDSNRNNTNIVQKDEKKRIEDEHLRRQKEARLNFFLGPAKEYMKVRDWDAAIVMLNACCNVTDQSSEVEYRLGQCWLAKDYFYRGRQHVDRAITLKKDTDKSIEGYQELLPRIRDMNWSVDKTVHADTEKLFNDLKLNPKSNLFKGYCALVDQYTKSENWKKVIEYCTKAISASDYSYGQTLSFPSLFKKRREAKLNLSRQSSEYLDLTYFLMSYCLFVFPLGVILPGVASYLFGDPDFDSVYSD